MATTFIRKGDGVLILSVCWNAFSKRELGGLLVSQTGTRTFWLKCCGSQNMTFCILTSLMASKSRFYVPPSEYRVEANN